MGYRKLLAVFMAIALTMAFLPGASLGAIPAADATQMYATWVDYGEFLPVNVDPFNSYHPLRLDPNNALGEFDAVQSAGGIANSKFVGLASLSWSEYRFDERFVNVDGETDIQFAEVTWGSATGWHAEAAQVILTDAIVGGDFFDEYFVGVVWNRIGVNYISAADRLAFAEGIAGDDRELAESIVETDGVKEWTGFNLPPCVHSAAGIKLIDVTSDVYTLAYPATYLNVSGTGATIQAISLPIPEAYSDEVSVLMGPDGNTDGFDLDAIRVWGAEDDICGYKLNSVTGEPVGGITIILEEWTGQGWEPIDRTMTGEDGRYCFLGLPAGRYRVTEDAAGWNQIYPDGGHIVDLPMRDVLYGIQRDTGKIFEVDPLTAAADEVFAITELPASNVGPNGLAFDSATGDLYFTSYRGLAKLYVTGDPVEEYLGDLPGEIACADFFNGRYYYIAGGTSAGFGGPTDDLYEVFFDGDGLVSSWNKFADISGDYNSAWTFDGDIAISADGVIFGFGKDNNGGGYEFFRVNRDGTGFEMIKDAGYTFSLQLAFGGDGVLYGHDARGGRFYEVNTSDGSISLISTNARMLYTDTASGTLSYNFENEPNMECFDETAWAAQNEPATTRFIPAPGNWATYVEVSKTGLLGLQGDAYEFPLYAGQTHYVGNLEVKAEKEHLWIRYIIGSDGEGFKEGYCGDWTGLTEFHLQVEDEFVGFNAVRTTVGKYKLPGSPIPGAFEYKGYFDEKTADSGWIDAGALTQFADDDIFIAAHAVVWWCGYPCGLVNDDFVRT